MLDGVDFNVYCCPMEDFPEDQKYQFLVSSLPLNNFDYELVRSILQSYQHFLQPGGKLSYFEYLAARKVRKVLSKVKGDHDGLRTCHLLEEFIKNFQLEHDEVIMNFLRLWHVILASSQIFSRDTEIISPRLGRYNIMQNNLSSYDLLQSALERYGDLPAEAVIKQDVLREGLSFSEDSLRIATGYERLLYFFLRFNTDCRNGEKRKFESARGNKDLWWIRSIERDSHSARVNPSSPYKVDLRGG